MIRAAACAVLIVAGVYAAPALSQDRAHWGPSYEHGTSVTLDPARGPAVATVTIRNRITGGHPNDTAASLSQGGLRVFVSVFHAPGDTPDTITVTPPDGYIAVPPVLDVPEGETGVVTIYSNDGAGA